jgi:hypothetical protein
VTVAEALNRLDRWIESREFRGWDPHDLLRSPVLRPLGRGHRLLGIALVQLGRWCPMNLRPLLGIHPTYNPKAMGLFLGTYARRYALAPEEQILRRVREFADWLWEHRVTSYRGAAWGYPFDWPNRAFFAAAGTPTIVNTAMIGVAFLEARRVLASAAHREQETADRFLEIARSACDFILQDLNRHQGSDGQLCFSYTPLDRRFVHNANVLGAQLLAETAAETGDQKLVETALAAARFTADAQQRTGAWPYGVGARETWVDSFHTGFVLVALKRIGAALGTGELDAATRSGYAFWVERMLHEGCLPKYYPDRLYPIDAHAVAQAILTLIAYRDSDSGGLERAQAMAARAIALLQDEDGFFYYQARRWYRNRVPYMRWSQAWMQRALTELVGVSRGKPFSWEPAAGAAHRSRPRTEG